MTRLRVASREGGVRKTLAENEVRTFLYSSSTSMERLCFGYQTDSVMLIVYRDVCVFCCG